MAIIMRFQCKRQKFFGVASQLVRGHALPQPDSLFIVVSVPDISAVFGGDGCLAPDIAHLPLRASL